MGMEEAWKKGMWNEEWNEGVILEAVWNVRRCFFFFRREVSWTRFQVLYEVSKINIGGFLSDRVSALDCGDLRLCSME